MSEIDIELYEGSHDGADIDEAIEEVSNIHSEIWGTSTIHIDDLTWTLGYINTSGEVQQHSSYAHSNSISVREGDVISYDLWGVNNTISVIAAYDTSDNFIASASIYSKQGASSGSSVEFTGDYTVPNGVAKLIFSMRYNDSSKISYLSIPVPMLKTDIIDERLDNVEATLTEAGIENQWKNKIWVCFGTSITDNWSQNAHVGDTDEPTGKYPPYLQQMGGFAEFPENHPATPDPTKSNNLGIAGGKINGHILYYIRYYLHDNTAGTQIASKANLITIEGAVNDFIANIPLGNVGDTVPFTDSLLPDSTSDGTFAGACFCAFTDAMQYAQNAVVVLLTETTGKQIVGVNDFRWNKVNGLGLKQIDYINMTKAVAEYVGIPVIDCGKDSMINAANPSYLADWIHHSYVGGKQYASAIWSKLKNIPCKVTSV